MEKNTFGLIADLDNYLNSGDTPLTKHHATVISAKSLMNMGMNATDTAEGGYANSRMATETLPSLVAEDGIIGKAFNSHILEYQNFLSNRINVEAINQTGGRWAGASDDWAWYLRKIDLMSEVNVYGSIVWSSSAYDVGIDNRQYAIFQFKPKLINGYGNARFSYWLKSVSDITRFTYVGANGSSDHTSFGATREFGVRPRFLIG